MGKKFKKKFWGGFVDNKLHVHQMDTGFGGIGSGSGLRQIPAIFTNWKSGDFENRFIMPRHFA